MYMTHRDFTSHCINVTLSWKQQCSSLSRTQKKFGYCICNIQWIQLNPPCGYARFHSPSYAHPHTCSTAFFISPTLVDSAAFPFCRLSACINIPISRIIALLFLSAAQRCLFWRWIKLKRVSFNFFQRILQWVAVLQWITKDIAMEFWGNREMLYIFKNTHTNTLHITAISYDLNLLECHILYSKGTI